MCRTDTVREHGVQVQACTKKEGMLPIICNTDLSDGIMFAIIYSHRTRTGKSFAIHSVNMISTNFWPERPRTWNPMVNTRFRCPHAACEAFTSP